MARANNRQTASQHKSTEVEIMDKDRVKGAIDDAAGRAKRQVGEWTGDKGAQAEGAAQQVKGKAEKAWGNVKDAARDAKNDVERDREKKEKMAQEQREQREKLEREHAVHGNR
jgi:uncharacterized protein YjbJ (UPF0337 family)